MPYSEIRFPSDFLPGRQRRFLDIPVMSKRKSTRRKADPGTQELFAWPFKVLHDLFHKPPFVADPEFTRFDFDALRSKLPRPLLHTPKLTFRQAGRGRLPLLLWLIVVVLMTLLGLIVL